jgi:endogenous inhibitor of DNA gyrase (YacG/DUF329 family)
MSRLPNPSPVRLVTCPGCGGKSVYGPGNPSRPFCSESCKNHDFGAWATESYRVDTTPQGDDDGTAPPDDTPH